MEVYRKILEKNKEWAAAQLARRSRVFFQVNRIAIAGNIMDRLQRQQGAGR